MPKGTVAMLNLIVAMILSIGAIGATSTAVALAQEGQEPPPEGHDAQPVRPRAESRDVRIVLTDYPGGREFLPGTRVVANDSEPPCNFTLSLSPDQLKALNSAGQSVITVPAACNTVLLVYLEEVNDLERADRRTAPRVVRKTKEYSLPLSLEGDVYLSDSLKRVIRADPIDRSQRGANDTLEAIAGNPLIWAGTVALVALMVSTVVAKSRKHV